MKTIIPILLLVAITFSCKKPQAIEIATELSFNNYDKKTLLENLGSNVIIPAYQEFYNATQVLNESCLKFQKNPTDTELINLQTSWRSCASAWKKCELFKVGPASNLGASYYTSLDFHPTNKLEIENIFKSIYKLDSGYVANKGASVKGIPALEYLLFDRANGNTSVLKSFIGSDLITQNKLKYILALSQNIKGKAKDLLNEWLPTNGNYIATFIANDKNDLDGSISVIINQLVYLIEIIKNEKINIPLGSSNNGIPLPALLEAAESESSLSHIKNNLGSIEKTFLGNGKGVNNEGFDDLLDYLNKKSGDTLLSQKITLQLNKVNTALNLVDPLMQNALLNNPATLIKVNDELSKLIALIKIDLATSCGVLITFTDNDGD